MIMPWDKNYEDGPEKNCKNCYFSTVMEKPCMGCEDDNGEFRNWVSDSFDPEQLKETCDNCKYYDAENDDKYDTHCVDCHIMASGRLSNWEPIEPEQSAKADTGKPRCDLVSPALIEAVGYIRGYGTEKYGSENNWETVETSRYLAALLRHLCAYMRDPKSIDDESGFYHLFHAACNINFLVDRLDKEKEPIK